jgi:hypothetical protein
MMGNKALRKIAALRGQILTTDFIVSIALFLAALLIFYLVWTNLSYSYWESMADKDMQVALLAASDSLLLTPGAPVGWEFGSQFSATSYGFATSPNMVSSAKIGALNLAMNSDYYSAKNIMGVGRFDVFITIERANDSVTIYSFGNFTKQGAVQVSSATSERLAVLDGVELVRVKVDIWRARGGQI